MIRAIRACSRVIRCNIPAKIHSLLFYLCRLQSTVAITITLTGIFYCEKNDYRVVSFAALFNVSTCRHRRLSIFWHPVIHAQAWWGMFSPHPRLFRWKLQAKPATGSVFHHPLVPALVKVATGAPHWIHRATWLMRPAMATAIQRLVLLWPTSVNKIGVFGVQPSDTAVALLFFSTEPCIQFFKTDSLLYGFFKQ